MTKAKPHGDSYRLGLISFMKGSAWCLTNCVKQKATGPQEIECMKELPTFKRSENNDAITSDRYIMVP